MFPAEMAGRLVFGRAAERRILRRFQYLVPILVEAPMLLRQPYSQADVLFSVYPGLVH